MHGVECLDGTAMSGNGILARVAIGSILQIGLGLFEQRLGFIQLLRRDRLGTRIASRLDGLARVAHFLHRSGGASDHAGAQ
jgi:hypothetical protein